MIEEPPVLTIRRPSRRPTAAQIAAFRDTPTGFVVDAMYGQGALSSEIQPLMTGADDLGQVAGPALTAENGPADIMATAAALAFLQPGDVLVAGFGGHKGCAASGDRTCGMMKNSGAVGFVTDGPMRDYHGIRQVGLPCWCVGLTPASPFTMGPGRIGLPLMIGGQRVETGDMIVADRDGVVVVPFDRLDEVIAALENVRALETALDAEVARGRKAPPAMEALLASDRVAYVD